MLSVWNFFDMTNTGKIDLSLGEKLNLIFYVGLDNFFVNSFCFDIDCMSLAHCNLNPIKR